MAQHLPAVDADDLEQEAILAALLGRKSILGPMQDLLRKQGWVKQFRNDRINSEMVGLEFAFNLANNDNQEALTVKHDLARHVEMAVIALGAQRQKMIRLRFWGGMTLLQCGTALGICESRAWQVEHEALAELHDSLLKIQ